MKNTVSIQYTPGLFDQYKSIDRLEDWEGFPELMWGLGFDMDCEHSFNIYRDQNSLGSKKSSSERDKKREILYLLERADRQIVGNFLFSRWRYYTHWAMWPYDEYDVDFLRRILAILEFKYAI